MTLSLLVLKLKDTLTSFLLKVVIDFFFVLGFMVISCYASSNLYFIVVLLGTYKTLLE